MSSTAETYPLRRAGPLLLRLVLVVILAVLAIHFLADVGAAVSGSSAALGSGLDLCSFHTLAALMPIAALPLLSPMAFRSRRPRVIPRRQSPPAIIHPPA